MKPFQINL